MPKHLAPGHFKGKTEEWVRERYLRVYAASMGNHSIARFYCHWTPEEYDRQVAEIPAFAAAIRCESLNVADRARYLLHEGLGLLTCNEEEPVTNSQALNILARLEGELRERGEIEVDKAKSGKGTRRSVVVEGLQRPRADISTL